MKISLKVLLLTFIIALGICSFAAAETVQQDTYTVQPGDSLWFISVRYQVGLSELIGANPQFKNPDLIYPGEKVTIPVIAAKTFEKEVIRLCNIERSKAGLGSLSENWEMSRVARYKSQDMINKDYFSHTSPTYGSPFDMMKAFGISYSAAGENIAMGQPTPSSVVSAWMKSPGHRQNILSGNYTEIGVGYAKTGSGTIYWTQMFRRP